MPSLDVLTEMVKSIKEDQLPLMNAEITRRLDSINGKVGRHDDDIAKLKEFRESHTGEIRGMRMVGALVLTLFGLLATFLALHKP